MSDQISAKDGNQAMGNISKDPDFRQVMAPLAGADANWEELLVSGTICIAIMGDLILKSRQSDFTLEKNAREGRFKLLKYPKSFRTSLMQVVNAVYNTFNTAHKNMNIIRQRALNTTDQVKQAVQILLRGTNEELEKMLGNIKETADQFLSLAQQIERESHLVMDLTAELLEACVVVQRSTEKELIENVIRNLSELRKKWGETIGFFQMMSDIIACSLNSTLKGFHKCSQVTSEQTLQGYSITSFKRDMIYSQAFEAMKIAYLVSMISGSYVEVSQAHLMERIAGLGKLLAYDPDKDKSVIARERLQLFERCEEAQFLIRTLFFKRKEEFDLQINARMQAVRHEFDAVIPAVQDGGECQKWIKDAVKRGIDSGSEKSQIDDIARHYQDI